MLKYFNQAAVLFGISLMPGLLAISPAVIADAYKWVNDKGEVVYSDRPRQQGYQTIQLPKSEPRQAQQLKQQLKRQQKLLEVMTSERAEKAKVKQQENEVWARKKEHQERCAKVRRQLQEISEARLVYERTADPNNPKVLSDVERAKQITKHSRYLNEEC